MTLYFVMISPWAALGNDSFLMFSWFLMTLTVLGGTGQVFVTCPSVGIICCFSHG